MKILRVTLRIFVFVFSTFVFLFIASEFLDSLVLSFFIALFLSAWNDWLNVRSEWREWLNIKPTSKPEITKASGTKLMALARFCYSTKTVGRIFEPIYADFCEEYYAALAADEKWKVRWIRLRFYKDFAKAIGLFGVVRLAKTVFEYWEKIA